VAEAEFRYSDRLLTAFITDRDVFAAAGPGPGR
jgi:hypothetical protein